MRRYGKERGRRKRGKEEREFEEKGGYGEEKVRE